MIQNTQFIHVNFNPIAFEIANIPIRWYSLSYIIGALLAILYINYLIKKTQHLKPNKSLIDDLLFFSIIGIILGGRLGFVIFYGFNFYLQHPQHIFYLWEGGMSYHGAFIGVIIAIYVLAKKYTINFWQISDLVISAMPIGLLLGRIANFINMELYGKPTNLPWAIIFNHVPLPRHPSQLYEALLEGVLLFILLRYLWHRQFYIYPGIITSIAIIYYALARIFVECFRQGEIYFFNIISMGQVLSFIMLIGGIIIGYHFYVKYFIQPTK